MDNTDAIRFELSKRVVALEEENAQLRKQLQESPKFKCNCESITPTYPLYRSDRHVEGCPLTNSRNQC